MPRSSAHRCNLVNTSAFAAGAEADVLLTSTSRLTLPFPGAKDITWLPLQRGA